MIQKQKWIPTRLVYMFSSRMTYLVGFMLDDAYVVYLYILIWIFITLLISYSTVTVTCLTREASYKGAGL